MSLRNLVQLVEPVSPESELHEFIETLKKFRAVPVGENGSVTGIIFADDVSNREYPIKMKAKAIASSVPVLDVESELPEAAVVMINGRNHAVPVVQNGKYIGILTEQALLGAAHFSSKQVREVMNEPVTISNKENVGKARSMMRDKHVGKLPVVNAKGEVLGIVDWRSFLATERPKESKGKRDLAGDYLQDYKFAVTAIMDSTPLLVDRTSTLADVVKRMNETRKSYALVVEEKKPVGIVTCEDLMEMVAAQAPKEGVYVQITGADGLDSFEVEKLNENINETVKKIGGIYAGIEYFFVHIKKHETQGKKIKFGVRTRLFTPVGTFHSRSHAWNLATAVDDAMDKLERIVKEDHKKKRSQERGRTERRYKER